MGGERADGIGEEARDAMRPWRWRQDAGAVKDFGQATAGRRLRNRYPRGLTTVPVARIVGSVGKAAVLDHRFRPRGGAADTRLRHLRRVDALAMCALPPVDLYELDGDYYVVDGHHRVALALENGQPEIDADVTVFVLDQPIPA